METHPNVTYLRPVGLLENLDAIARRGLDIVAAAVGLLALAPFFLFIAYLIKRDSPGPVFFRGTRVGKDGRPFQILKFRTMFECPESYRGPKITAQGDARITPVGRWLRATKLNELPQLWNVLKGEMSLVGPRPEDPEIAAAWSPGTARELLSVRPGITSPASIVYRDEESLLQTGNVMDDYLRSIVPSKLRLDLLYVRNRNLFTDLDVIFWTLVVLIPHARRQPVPETRLYWGPFATFMGRDFRWFVLDFVVALGSVTAVGVIWRSITPLHIGWTWAPLIAFGMAVTFSLSNAIMGLNRIMWEKARLSDALELLLPTALAGGALLLLNRLLITKPMVPLGLFVIGGLVAYLGFVAVRYRERILTGIASRWLELRGGGSGIGERVLIVGAGELSQFATWLVRKGNLAQAFSIVGMVDDDPRKQGMRIEGKKVLGTTQSIPELVARYDVGLLLFAISNIQPQEQKRVLDLCNQTPARLVMIPNIIQVMRAHFQSGSLEVAQAGARQHFADLPESIQPQKAHAWMEELESLLHSGNYQESLTKIAQIKAALDNNGRCRKHPPLRMEPRKEMKRSSPSL